MQRRLTMALVSLTLFAVALVGIGVLALAQIGAKNDTEQQVSDSAAAIKSIIELSGDHATIERLGPSIRRLGTGVKESEFHFVAIDSEGHVVDRQGVTKSKSASTLLRGFTLESDQFDQITDGQLVFLDRGKKITAIQILDIQSPRLEQAGLSLGIVIIRPVATLPAQTKTWFLLAAALAIGTSIIVASGLARRFTAPIKEIEAATAKLAAGDLATRVRVAGTGEVAELGQAVNKMASDLERSRVLEQQFLMSVSHDLRTPLTAIGGYAEALIDDAIDDPVQAGTIIKTHAGRLERLVSDLLDLAKLDARQFAILPSTIDPGAAVARTVEGLRPIAEGHGLALQFESSFDSTIELDPDRFAQVIANLIENAIKYAQTTITVTVLDQQRSDGSIGVEVMVKDDGPGISAVDLPHVFDRLYVTQQRPVRAENSSGLGLAIVHDLTHAMGGTVTADSASDTGTTIRLRF